MQDNKWRKLKAETDQLFFFFLHTGKTRLQNTPNFDPLWKKDSFGVFHIHFPSEGPRYFLKVTYPRNHLFFFFIFFFWSHSPLFSRSWFISFIWIPTLPVEIWHYLLSKLSFLLFPGCPSALSLAACADLVADITAVDISVLLLFSVNVLRGCSAFFSQ